MSTAQEFGERVKDLVAVCPVCSHRVAVNCGSLIPHDRSGRRMHAANRDRDTICTGSGLVPPKKSCAKKAKARRGDLPPNQ